MECHIQVNISEMVDIVIPIDTSIEYCLLLPSCDATVSNRDFVRFPWTSTSEIKIPTNKALGRPVTVRIPSMIIFTRKSNQIFYKFYAFLEEAF